MITDQQLAEWEALCEAATKAPWRLGPYGGVYPIGEGPMIAHAAIKSDYLSNWQNNEHFIAASRDAMPKLIAEVRRLRTDGTKDRQYLTGKEVDLRADNERLRAAKQATDALCSEAAVKINEMRTARDRLRERLQPIVDCYGLGNTPEKFVEQVHEFIMEAREELQRKP